MCKPQMVILTLSFLFCSVLVSGQEINIIFLDKDLQGVQLESSGFEPLKEFICASESKCETPRHDFFWIFSDGTFLNHHPDSTVLRKFRGSGGTTMVEALVRSTGLYTDTDDDVPDLLINPDNSGTTTFPLDPSVSPNDEVEPGLYLKLQSNHRELTPSDGTFLILSIQNPTTEFLSGYLIVFFKPVLDTIYVLEDKELTYAPVRGSGNVNLFPQVALDTHIFYPGYIQSAFSLNADDLPFDGEQDVTGNLNIKNSHKKFRVFQFFGLPPGEERQIYVQIETPSDLLAQVPGGKTGALRFLTAMLVDTTDAVDVTDFNGAFGAAPVLAFSEEEEQRISELQLDQYLRGLLNNRDIPDHILVDIDEHIPLIRKSHDPNYLLLESCECPAQDDGKTKVLATVHFSNEGSAPTSDILVTIDFPAAYDVTSLSNVVDIFPKPADMSAVQVNREGNKVTWNLNGFRLRPESDFGVGHPATYGYIKFTVLTDETNTDALPPLQACILFDPETSDPVDTVCTIPVIPIKLLDVLTDSTSLEILECGQCVADGPFAANGFPWWLILLLILILGTAAFLILTNL